MNIEQVEKETVSAMKGLADVLKVKTEEIRALDAAKLATDSIFNPTFANLTEESQRAAREVLSNMLVDSYRHNFKLTHDEILELGHRVRKAFVTLESEESKAVSLGMNDGYGAFSPKSSSDPQDCED